MNSTEYRPFDGFTFPYPDLPEYKDASRSFTAPSGSLLTPFFNMLAVLPGNLRHTKPLPDIPIA